MSERPLDQIGRGARRVLEQNDLGTMIAAAPRLYPHQWSWDAAFISIGLARVSVPRALAEFRTLLAAQWSTGMIPHIVFSPGTDYYPGPGVWGTDRAAAKPEGVETSGICQPPVHAIALARIVRIASEVGGETAQEARNFASEAVPKLAAWHRWLATARDPDGMGLVQIHHSWESGMDDSPRWDAAYGAVVVEHETGLRRHDTALVTDAVERPSDSEYQRYLHLVAQMRSVDYDDSRITEIIDFRLGDVFITALLAVAAEELAELGRDLGIEDQVVDQPGIAARARLAVLASVDPRSGLCRDWNARTGEWTGAQSLASFSVLLCGGDDEVYRRQRDVITGPHWAGHPDLLYALPPTLSPDDPGFRPRTYWRGPIWPVMNWLFSWAFERHGDTALAGQWRDQGLAQLGDLAYGEYYDALNGDPLGSQDQSWTAAAALDWLAADRSTGLAQHAPTNLRDHPGAALDRPLRLAVAGAGARGTAYARHLQDSGGRAVVTAVAEPRPGVRADFAGQHGIADEQQFERWEDLVAAPRTCDAVVIGLQDSDHLAAATAFARAGYDILLEKPMAPTEAECRQIVEECDRAGVFLGICHVLRYAPYTQLVRDQIRAGAIGDVVNVQHLEPVGFWHFAHSYVRGSWRDSKASAPVLLTKSSHDIDWLSYVIGRPARRVVSFGSLNHFRPDQAPAGAAERCLDCEVEASCPYSAVRIYRRGLDPTTREGYFTAVMAPEMTPEAVDVALRHGPYGRCVYSGGNDVVDHQIVGIDYEDGVTADFSVSAFSPVESRRTRIFGTRGQITTDGNRVWVFDFLTQETTEHAVTVVGASAGEGHAGGDTAMIAAFVQALAAGDPSAFSSDGRTSLATHSIVFAAERSRASGAVVEM